MVNPLINGDFQFFSRAKLKKTRGFYGIRILGYTMVYRYTHQYDYVGWFKQMFPSNNSRIWVCLKIGYPVPKSTNSSSFSIAILGYLPHFQPGSYRYHHGAVGVDGRQGEGATPLHPSPWSMT